MEIMLPPGEKIRLANDYNVSRITLWKALTGQSKSPKANMLRKAALERGGKVYDGMKSGKEVINDK